MARCVPRILIGRGGMGELWLGLLEGPEGFRRPVVIKRALTGTGVDAEAMRRALAAEARLGAALSHPNIVGVYDFRRSGDELVLVLEYLEGASVRTLLQQLSLADASTPWPIAARIVADAARGLDAAHRATDLEERPLAVVHRDVSPENLVLTTEGITKVVDFGIAGSRLRTATASLVVRGKLGYAAPEQIAGAPVDWRADVFALGVVLHELLCGRAAFRRRTEAETLDAVRRAAIPPLPEATPRALGDLLGRMLARDPAHRTLRAADVADELDAIAIGRGGGPRDAAAFLRAELSEVIEERRRWRLELAASEVTSPSAGPRPAAGDLLDVTTGSAHQVDAWMRAARAETTAIPLVARKPDEDTVREAAFVPPEED